MTQLNSVPVPAPAPVPVGILPRPGMIVKLKDTDGRGVVIEHDDWWDTLLIRGVDISAQTLVDWTAESGVPVVRWERTSQLEEIKPSG